MAAPKAVPGEFIVKLRRGVSPRKVFSGAMAQNLFQKKKMIRGSKSLVQVKVRPQAQVAMLKAFSSNPEIQYIEPNYIVSIPKNTFVGKKPGSGLPDDEFYKELWGLHNKKGFDVDAPEAWRLTKGSKKIVVAVIDTGVDYNHPDLKANMWVNKAELNGEPGVDNDGNGYIGDVYGYDFANNDNDPMDDQGHGTHCAGTIGAVHNKIGVAGVTSRVRIMALKFLTANGGGTTAAAIEAIYYAANNGAHIMSNSWGGGGKSRALKEAIQYANNKGVLFTAAAGNDNKNNDRYPSYPANYKVDNVISVAAYAEDGERAYVIRNGRKIVFSNYGAETVHVAAPGAEILSTIPGGEYAKFSGTSMATPHVSGVLALLLSLDAKNLVNFRGAEKNTNVNPGEIRDLLIKTSVPAESMNEMTISNGRVSAARLLKAAIRRIKR